MRKEFHLYTAHAPADRVDEYDVVMALIDEGEPIIKTTQIMACTTELFNLGYRIFMHTEDDDFEITLGDCARTTREIRMAHNLPNLIIKGEFTSDRDTKNYALTLTTISRGHHPTAIPTETTYVYVFDSMTKRDKYANILEAKFDADGYPIDESAPNPVRFCLDMDDEAIHVSSKLIKSTLEGYFVDDKYKISEDERSLGYEYKLILD